MSRTPISERKWSEALSSLLSGTCPSIATAADFYSLPLKGLKDRYFCALRTRQKNLTSLVVRVVPKNTQPPDPLAIKPADQSGSNPDPICSLCHCSSIGFHDLVDESIALTFELKVKLRNIFAQKMDIGKLRLICFTCENKLNDLHEFHQSVLENQMRAPIDSYMPDLAPYQYQKVLQSASEYKLDEADHKILRYFRFTCEECQNRPEFAAFEPLLYHYKELHAHLRPLMRCFNEACTKTLTNRRDLLRHIDWCEPSSRDTRFQCELCSESFLYKRQLPEHFRQVHGLPAIYCKPCNIRFDSRVDLQKHRDDLHGPRIHWSRYGEKTICDICGRTITFGYLAQHVRDLHPETVNGNAEPFRCTWAGCNKLFPSYVRLRNHVSIMHKHGTGDFPCPHCGKILHRRYTLTAHIRQYHQGVKYRCSVCEKVCTTSEHLKQHLNVHGMGQKRPCPYCPAQFNFISNRSQHIKIHHPVEWQQRQANRAKSLSITYGTAEEEKEATVTEIPRETPTAEEISSVVLYTPLECEESVFYIQ